MPPYIETIIYIFALIALGYFAVWTRFLKADIGDAIATFIFSVGAPLLLFRNIIKADMSQGDLLWIWGSYFSAIIVVWTISHLTIQFVFGRDTRSGVVAGISGAFSNAVLVGIPLIEGIYGDQGLAILSKILTVHLPTMLAATIILFEWAGRKDGVDESAIEPLAIMLQFVKKLFSNPLVAGILAGFVFKIFAIDLPNIGWRLVDNLAATVGPIALFSLGMAVRRYGVSGQITPAFALVSFKLFLMPAVMLAIGLMVGLPEITTRILVSIAALPVGVNAWLVAAQFGTGQRLAATSITIGTASAVLSTSLWLLILDRVF